MSRLFQIQLSNGSIYLTREDSIEKFHKSKFYELKRGCVVNNVTVRDGQAGVQMLDMSKNTFFELPVLILSSCINEVVIIKKRSQFEELYLKTTSGIEIVKGGNNGFK